MDIIRFFLQWTIDAPASIAGGFVAALISILPFAAAFYAGSFARNIFDRSRYDPPEYFRDALSRRIAGWIAALFVGGYAFVFAGFALIHAAQHFLHLMKYGSSATFG